MHNAAFAHIGWREWRYELWNTPPEDVATRMRWIRTTDEVRGSNVTIPHKQAVMPHLDEISPHARAIGAVNTIIKRDMRLIGDNTDWMGFLNDLQTHDVSVNRATRALVFGAGGSARAIVYALLMRGAAVSIVNRDWARAEQLAGDMRALFDTARVEVSGELDAVAPRCDLIVNCTSLGMSPNDGTTPWQTQMPFSKSQMIYDLVYKPRTTRLMQQAQSAGARVINGLGMLVEQGAAAFELWTGVAHASVSDAMRAAIL